MAVSSMERQAVQFPELATLYLHYAFDMILDPMTLPEVELTDDQVRRVRRELKDPPPDVKQWGHFRDRKQGTVKLVAPSTVVPPAPAAFPAAAYRAETTPRALQPLPWRFDNSR